MDVKAAVSASANPPQFVQNVLSLIGKLSAFGPGLLKALSTLLVIEQKVAPFLTTLFPAAAPFLGELQVACQFVIDHGPEVASDLEKVGDLVQALTGLDLSSLKPAA